MVCCETEYFESSTRIILRRAFGEKWRWERLGNVGCVIAAVVRYHRPPAVPWRVIPVNVRHGYQCIASRRRDRARLVAVCLSYVLILLILSSFTFKNIQHFNNLQEDFTELLLCLCSILCRYRYSWIDVLHVKRRVCLLEDLYRNMVC